MRLSTLGSRSSRFNASFRDVSEPLQELLAFRQNYKPRNPGGLHCLNFSAKAEGLQSAQRTSNWHLGLGRYEPVSFKRLPKFARHIYCQSKVARSTNVDFNYQTPKCNDGPAGRDRYGVLKVLERNDSDDLDYVLVQLMLTPGASLALPEILESISNNYRANGS
jgi:hypothetical protein